MLHLLRRLRHPTPLLGPQEPTASVLPGQPPPPTKAAPACDEQKVGGIKPGKKMDGLLLDGEGTAGTETVAVTQKAHSHTAGLPGHILNSGEVLIKLIRTSGF